MARETVPALEIIRQNRTTPGGGQLLLIAAAIVVVGATFGGASLLEYGEPILVLGVAVWLLAEGRAVDYVEFVVLLAFVSPELRRYIDFHSSFHSESTVLVAPDVAMMLGVLFTWTGPRPRGLLVREFTYLAGVIVLYAGVVALALGTSKTAIVADGLTWLPPVVFGVFLLSGAIARSEFESMVGRVVPILLLFFAIYGFVQWVVAPPWDRAWLENIGTAGQSFGQPKAFGLRVWSFSSSPGGFAGSLAWLIVITLGRARSWYRGARLIRSAAVLSGLLALGITGVRAAWIELAIGVIVLVWYGRVRVARLIAAGLVLVLVAGLISPVSSLLTQRLGSIAQGKSGQSANARLTFQSSALPEALRDPVGMGLGSTGAGVRAGDLQTNNPYANTDSGYVEMLREFGSLPGGVLLAMMVVVCVSSVLDGYSEDAEGASWAAINAAVPISLLFGATWGVTLFTGFAAAAMGRSRLLDLRRFRVGGSKSDAERTYGSDRDSLASREIAETLSVPGTPALTPYDVRVVYLDHTAQLSGAELALTRLLNALNRVDKHVILSEDGPLVDRLRASGVSVEILPLPTRTGQFRKDSVGLTLHALVALADTLIYSVRLSRRLRRLSPDVIHANSLKAGVFGCVAARLAGYPVIWNVHDRVDIDYLSPSGVRMIRFLASHVPAAVVANSATTSDTLTPGTPTSVIPCVVDAMPEITVPRRTSERVLVVGMVGRIAWWKGQHLFLRAFSSAFRDGTERAMIVGAPLFGSAESKYFESLKDLAAELGLEGRVDFRGHQDDVSRELERMDVLVHASLRPEPFGQVVTEGMAAGLPVIAANGGGPGEIVTHGVDGLLYEMGDLDELARWLSVLADDENLRQQLGSAGRQRVAEFAPDRIEQLMMGVYNAVITPHPVRLARDA
jgi:glycosyltransferase involved in cell wall biosynthesis